MSDVENLIIEQLKELGTNVSNIDRSLTMAVGTLNAERVEIVAKINLLTDQHEKIKSDLKLAWQKYDALRAKIDRAMYIVCGACVVLGFMDVPQKIKNLMGW